MQADAANMAASVKAHNYKFMSKPAIILNLLEQRQYWSGVYCMYAQTTLLKSVGLIVNFGGGLSSKASDVLRQSGNLPLMQQGGNRVLKGDSFRRMRNGFGLL